MYSKITDFLEFWEFQSEMQTVWTNVDYMEEKNDQVHSSLESSEQEYYAFILGKSLRIDDNHEQVLKIYDSIPRAYSQSQVGKLSADY